MEITHIIRLCIVLIFSYLAIDLNAMKKENYMMIHSLNNQNSLKVLTLNVYLLNFVQNHVDFFFGCYKWCLQLGNFLSRPPINHIQQTLGQSVLLLLLLLLLLLYVSKSRCTYFVYSCRLGTLTDDIGASVNSPVEGGCVLLFYYTE